MNRNLVDPTAALPETELALAEVALRRGGLVAFPTETVYGLGADASNPDALNRLYAVKGRPTHHPVIVHLASAAQLDDWARDIPAEARLLADAFWPGPLTLILPRASHVLDAVTGGQDTVGLRVPNQSLALALLQRFQGGVAAPSANRFGRISPTRAEHVREDLGGDVDVILDGGDCQVGVESTIVSLVGPEPVLLRPGGILPEQLSEVLGREVVARKSETIRVSGALSSHYAPRTPLQLVPSEELDQWLSEARESNLPVAVLARRPAPAQSESPLWLEAPDEPEGYARDLYANLRRLDALKRQRIWVEAVPDGPEWVAVQDRLRRAAHDSLNLPRPRTSASVSTTVDPGVSPNV